MQPNLVSSLPLRSRELIAAAVFVIAAVVVSATALESTRRPDTGAERPAPSRQAAVPNECVSWVPCTGGPMFPASAAR